MRKLNLPFFKQYPSLFFIMKKMVKSNVELHFRLLHLHPHYGKPALIFYSAFHTPILCRLHVRREYLAADAEMNPAASHM